MQLLLSDLVEVFGSNLIGVHGRGHAKHAQKYRGAEPGVGVGRTGMSYALPTKANPGKTLSLSEIGHHLEDLYQYATDNPQTRFISGRLGCGLAGIEEHKMLQLIQSIGEVPKNLRWPMRWLETLAPDRYRVALIIAGTRKIITGYDKYAVPYSAIYYSKQVLNDLINQHGKERVIGVSGKADGPDTWGEAIFRMAGIPILECPAEWKVFGKYQAGHIRNQFMSMLGTDLLSMWDGESNGTKTMIQYALNDQLNVKVTNLTHDAFRIKSLDQAVFGIRNNGISADEMSEIPLLGDNGKDLFHGDLFGEIPSKKVTVENMKRREPSIHGDYSL